MTEEMKLLRELCKALGFTVETVVDHHERKEAEISEMLRNQIFGTPPSDRYLKCTPGTNKINIDDDGLYTSRIKEPEISYKLTRTVSD